MSAFTPLSLASLMPRTIEITSSAFESFTLTRLARALNEITAGIATARPIAVAQRASEIPFITTSGPASPIEPRSEKAFMIPSTVPSSPIKGVLLPRVDKTTNLFSNLGNNAPFIGLLGTVLGIIRAFEALGTNPDGGTNGIMIGISHALYATAAGLAVAIPAVIIFNALSKKAKALLSNSDEIVSIIQGLRVAVDKKPESLNSLVEKVNAPSGAEAQSNSTEQLASDLS